MAGFYLSYYFNIIVPTMEAKTDVFHAVADANRRKMMDLLLLGEKPVGELVDHFNITFAGVSQHLKILTEAGLVTKRKKGRFHYYRADPVVLKEVHDWVSQYEKFWTTSLKKLGRHLDEI